MFWLQRDLCKSYGIIPILKTDSILERLQVVQSGAINVDSV